MLYCPNFFWNVLQVWMTGKDVHLQMTWSWPDKTWNILCSYCLQWNTSQSKFRNHYFLFYLRFPYCPNFFWFGVVDILYYNENYSNKNSDKPYIAIVVCLLVTLNQWKHLNLLFIQLQSISWVSSAGRIWSFRARAHSSHQMEICYWSQNRASLTRYAWQSQLLPNRDFDFISIYRAALTLLHARM